MPDPKKKPQPPAKKQEPKKRANPDVYINKSDGFPIVNQKVGKGWKLDNYKVDDGMATPVARKKTRMSVVPTADKGEFNYSKGDSTMQIKSDKGSKLLSVKKGVKKK